MKKLGRIKLLTIAAVSAIALAGSIAVAQTVTTDQNKQATTAGHRHGGHWGRGGRMHGMMFRGLNLTDDQKAKMKQIGESYRQNTASLRQELKTKRQALRKTNEGGTFNEALATQTLQDTAGLQAKLMGERFKLRQEMLAVLTPEQKTQLDQKRAEFKAKRSERRGDKNQ